MFCFMIYLGIEIGKNAMWYNDILADLFHSLWMNIYSECIPWEVYTALCSISWVSLLRFSPPTHPHMLPLSLPPPPPPPPPHYASDSGAVTWPCFSHWQPQPSGVSSTLVRKQWCRAYIQRVFFFVLKASLPSLSKEIQTLRFYSLTSW